MKLDLKLVHWRGPECIQNFVTWLDRLLGGDDDDDNDNDDDSSSRRPRRKIIVVAHNFQGYDSYFMMQEDNRQSLYFTPIVNGGKVLGLKVGKPGREALRFIDSMSFLPMSLAKFTAKPLGSTTTTKLSA